MECKMMRPGGQMGTLRLMSIGAGIANSVGTTTRLQVGIEVFFPTEGTDFFFSTALRPVLGPTQSPVQ
jgi:hypothetical protein